MRAITIAAFYCVITVGVFAQTENKLWYNHPASWWTEALPLGNGTLGAMVYGGVHDELLQLNEATLWSGGPVNHEVNPDAPVYLPKLREALFSGEYDSAISLAKKMQGVYSENYLPLGDVSIHQHFTGDGPATSYYRELNIRDAVSTTKFTINGTTYKREIFISAPDKVMVVRISADQPKQLSIDVNLASRLQYDVHVAGNDGLVLKGRAPAHSDPSYYDKNRDPVVYEDASRCNGMRFELQVKALHKEGVVASDAKALHITGASEIILLFSAATSFNGFNKCPFKDGKDEHLLAENYITEATKMPYDILVKKHLADHHKYYNRVALSINDNQHPDPSLPTDARLKAYTKGGNDFGLEALYFNYGRYLLISSSRTDRKSVV